MLISRSAAVLNEIFEYLMYEHVRLIPGELSLDVFTECKDHQYLFVKNMDWK